MSSSSGFRNQWSGMMAESEGIDVAPPQLQEFVPGVSPDISLFSTVSIYGKRKSGKSVFIKWFLQSYKEWFPWYWVFTLTQLNSFYESFIAAKFVIPEFDAEMMERVMERQTLARKLAEEQIIQGDGVKINPRACIIWDDYNGNDVRHYFTLNLFAAQHITLTPPAIRSNTDLVILFNTDYSDSLEHYHRDFGGKMPKETFYQMFMEATREPHTFLAINNDPNIPYNQKFYKGIATVLDEGPQWIVGCEEMWKENLEQLKDIFSNKYTVRFQIGHDMAQRKPLKKEEKTVPPKHPDTLNFKLEGGSPLV